jgi:hypothetical protein
VRALLLKPAALGAAIVLGLFGVALMAFGAFAVHAPAANAQSSDCASPPTTATVLSSSHGTERSGLTRTVASVSDSLVVNPTTEPTVGGPATTVSPSTTQTPSASSSLDSSATPTPTPTPTATPTATTTTTSSPPPTPELCVLVQSYPSDGDVLAGDSASYVVWVWSLTADGSNVAVTASVSAASYLGTPGFTICPSASGATCTIASLPVGDVYELLATVPVTADAPLDTVIDLTATATATGASSDSDDAIDTVVSPTTAASSDSSTSGSDGTLDVVPPLEALPSIPGTGVTATDPYDLFPTVSPSPSSSGSLGLPPAKVHHTVAAAETAYAVPIDPRLLGAQIVGLVALVGGITIAIVRLSLRKPLPATSESADPTDKTVAS